MSDLREQLLKAGLVSAKQVRAAKHEERVHRKEVGHEGLEAEKAERERLRREEESRKKEEDRHREEARRRRTAEEEGEKSLERWIRSGWIREATGGNKRFFFLSDGSHITYLDLSDQAVRRLQSGNAAIVATGGAVRGAFCLIDATTAGSLSRDHGEVIRFWNRTNER